MAASRRILGIVLLSAGTLLAELALTRLLSVSLFHHFAFLVVSTALFGTGFSGVLLAVSPRLDRVEPGTLAWIGALIFGAGLPISVALAQGLELEPLAALQDPGAFLRLGLGYVLLALPFGGTGLALAALLSERAEDTPWLYAADLLGAGLGGALGIVSMKWVGAPGAVLLGGGLGLLAAVCFSGSIAKIRGLAAAAGSLASLGLAPSAPSWFPLHITSAKTTLTGEPFERVLRDPARTKATDWNAISRIDLVDFGRNGERLIVDGGVAVVRVPRPGWVPEASDATLPYELRERARVLIVGSGAGWEVKEALRYGAAFVDAVEVNALIDRHVPSELRTDERVRFIVDEGRSFLERHAESYDVIVMIHTISNAATSAGGLHLAEDYLLTVEALQATIRALRPGGILFLTRPEAQLPRLVSTLRSAALGKLGRRLFAWKERAQGSSFYGALFYCRDGCGPEDEQRIETRIGERKGLELLLAPGRMGHDSLLRSLVAGAPLGDLEDRTVGRLDPATDDRPFFHQRVRFRDLGVQDLMSAFGAREGARMALEHLPLSELAVLLLLIQTILIAAVWLLLPPILKRSRLHGTSRREAATVVSYFAAIGLGFMLVEIALVQKLGLVLGRPVLAFAVVFSGLLVGAGAGSLASRRLSRPWLAPTVAALGVAGLAVIQESVLPHLVPSAESLRIASSLVLVLGFGACLGLPFPTAMRALGPRLPILGPWAFAVNGVFSILGSSLALVLGTEIGFRGVLAVAALAYVSATFLARSALGKAPEADPIASGSRAHPA